MWRPPPYPGTTLGPGHDNTLQTMLSIILHVFYAPLHSQTPRFLCNPKQAISHIPMDNAVINQDTGAS
jgi:hypothetical protein